MQCLSWKTQNFVTIKGSFYELKIILYNDYGLYIIYIIVLGKKFFGQEEMRSGHEEVRSLAQLRHFQSAQTLMNQWDTDVQINMGEIQISFHSLYANWALYRKFFATCRLEPLNRDENHKKKRWRISLSMISQTTALLTPNLIAIEAEQILQVLHVYWKAVKIFKDRNPKKINKSVKPMRVCY